MEKVCADCRKIYRRFLIWLLAAGIAGCVVYYIYAVKNLIPDTINLNRNSVEKLNFNSGICDNSGCSKCKPARYFKYQHR